MGKKIGLIDVDSKWPNLALMKLSAYHKVIKGDSVNWCNSFGNHDRVYISKVFSFTPDFDYTVDGDVEVVKGGSGYSLVKQLPKNIEKLCPDYGLYHGIYSSYAMGFTTRGCVRKCEFCVVPKKEGKIHVVADIESFWRGQERVVLLDNNLTAAPDNHFAEVLIFLIENRLLNQT